MNIDGGIPSESNDGASTTSDGGFPLRLHGSEGIGTDGKGGGSAISLLSGSSAQLMKEARDESLPLCGRGRAASPLCLGTRRDEISPRSQ
mmetsp:Transcript_32292/g.70668  ORF Transcript_32292/g.70668 Transcript_32292/m.70668 type:complete len:90 (+) Transcript_32292:314-583(+)